MNFSTVFVFLLVCISVVYALKSVIKHGMSSCSGSCGSCSSGCHSDFKQAIAKAKEELRKEKALKSIS